MIWSVVIALYGYFFDVAVEGDDFAVGGYHLLWFISGGIVFKKLWR
jgi:hypothetical protein